MSLKPAALTFIIPAYNAAMTLAETIASLQAQTQSDWKAIVVDDGSTDNTSEIIAQLAQHDDRLSFRRQENGGVCRARNLGFELADTEWVCFLDADDWVSTEFVRDMMAAAGDDIDFVYCDYRRVAPDGSTAYEFRTENLERDGFLAMARSCHVCIHGVVVRRAIVAAAGGFDTSLTVCEDWDLWVRILRMTNRIKRAPGTLAHYRMGDISLSRDHVQMVTDGLTVIANNHRRDPRLSEVLDEYAEGLPVKNLKMQSTYFVVWNAAADIGAGRDGSRLLKQLPEVDYGGYDPALAETIIEGLAIGARIRVENLVAHWPEFSDNTHKLIQGLAAHSSKAEPERGLIYAVECELLKHHPVGSSAELTLATKLSMDIHRLRPVTKPPQIDVLLLEVTDNGEKIGLIEMGLLGDLSAGDVRRLAAEGLGLSAYLRHSKQWMSPLVAGTAGFLFTKRMCANAIDRLRHNSSQGLGFRKILRRTLYDAIDRCAGRSSKGGHFAMIDQVLNARPATVAAPLTGLPTASVAERTALCNELMQTLSTRRVPILAYHRIADEGPEALRTWRVDPDMFEQQLRMLRENGFYSVTSREILKHREAGLPLPGRPIHFTFDDAYQDFADTAWPLLKAYGFTAEVFVVTDKVGQTSDWDISLQGNAPLMNWDTIEALHKEGVVFGSHLQTHTPASNLSSIALLHETVNSRAALEKHLGVPVVSIAAPYGSIGERYNRMLEAAGYRFGVSCEWGPADISSNPYIMPRVEVDGHWPMTEFARMLSLPAPDVATAAATDPSLNAEDDLVSVIIPAFNAEETIDETLTSVRTQTYANLEILVIDDGSTDQTAQVVLEHAAQDARVRLITQANAGVAAARNNGIARARGELIAPIDSDDLWAPEKIRSQVMALKYGGSHVALVYTWFAVINQDSCVIDLSVTPQDEGYVMLRLCSGNFIGNASSPLMRKSAILEAGGYDTSLKDRKAQGCEDLLLYFRISKEYEFRVIRDYLTGYRRMPQAMSSDVFQMLRSFQIVAEEMRLAYPCFATQTVKGEVWISEWLFWKAVRAGKLFSAASLVLHIAKCDSRFAISNVLPGFVTKTARKLMSSPRYVKTVSPEGRFVVGGASPVEAIK